MRAQLAAVSDIRDFASRELGLPDNGSYRSYADIGRSNVVWNVFAAPEFSVDAKRWCYPIVGCVAYRGYFSEQQAREYAAQLRAAGYDVAVRGARRHIRRWGSSPIRCSIPCWAGAMSIWRQSFSTS
jgi:predicted aminopeptidase